MLYIKEDARAVRQPVYGLLAGNLLGAGLVLILRLHTMAPITGATPDFVFLDTMGWLMIWGTLLLFIDSILIILVYERLGQTVRVHTTARIITSTALVLTFDQIGFFSALHYAADVPLPVLFGGWAAKMIAAVVMGCMAGFYLRFCERPAGATGSRDLRDLFDALTYRERYEELLRTARLDGLTGLRNRDAFDAECPALLAQARTAQCDASLLVIDLDHFKSVNDGLGHTAGDEALRRIASTIAKRVPEGSSVYRYGGEEFAVFLPAVAHDEAVAVADVLRRDVSSAEIPGWLPGIRASIGVATAPADGEDIAELFQSADARLYAAKSSGRDNVVGQSVDEDRGDYAASPQPL
jgi:diguanylate cyclase (GGDEF)-like protein